MKITNMLFIAMFSLVFIAGCVSTPTETWVENTQTFLDGGSDLRLESFVELTNNTFEYVYSFKQNDARRNISLTLNNGSITHALVDGVWDEINRQYLRDSFYFIPMACEEYIWYEWYENSTYNFYQGPSLDNLIRTFYKEEFGFEVRVELSDLPYPTCRACFICEAGIRLDLHADIINRETLLNHNWTLVTN